MSLMIDVATTALQPEEIKLIKHPQVSGIILFKKNYHSKEQLIRERSIRAIKENIIIGVDHEGGRVQRFQKDFTRLPSMRSVGELYRQDHPLGLKSAKLLGWLGAVELLTVGIDLNFAPVLDLDRGLNSVIGDRSFANDPEVVTLLASQFVDGMSEAGMAAVGKHFPGHGGVKADSHLEVPVDHRGFDEIENSDLVPFRNLSTKLDAIMAAHIEFPAVDKQLVTFSRKWLQDILRKKMNFSGVIFSDDLNMGGAANGGDMRQRVKLAYNSGCNIILICHNRDAVEDILYSNYGVEDCMGACDITALRGKAITLKEAQSHPYWQAAHDIITILLANQI